MASKALRGGGGTGSEDFENIFHFGLDSGLALGYGVAA
jgi:hypothetical protein